MPTNVLLKIDALPRDVLLGIDAYRGTSENRCLIEALSRIDAYR